MDKPIIILGANNPETGRMIEAVRGKGYYSGFLDRDHAKLPRVVCGLAVLGGDEEIPRLVSNGCRFVNVVSGSTVARLRAALAVIEAGGELLDFIHPSVDWRFERGIGTYVQAGVDIQAGVRMGDNNAIHLGALISHETVIGHSCFIGAANIAGKVRIEDGAYIGIGSTIIPGIHIGKWATVGAGAVVIYDVGDGETVVGNPARVIKTLAALPYETGAIR